MEVTLRALARPATGKGSARQTRLSGRVPAVLYGVGIEPVSLSVDAKQMGHALHTAAGGNVLINLEIEGGSRYLTLVREVQKHPVRNTLTHVDFVNASRDTLIHASVPVALVGDSIGVKLGGILEHHVWDLAVEALPASIPDTIEVDITDLEVGQHLRAGDIALAPGVSLVTPADEIVVSIVEAKGGGAADEAPAESE